MKKLIKLTLLAVLLGIHPVSCNRYGDDNCGDLSGYPKLYRIVDIGHSFYSLNHVADEMYRPNVVIETNNHYHPDSIGIGFFANKTEKVASVNQFSFGFSQSAVACSPVPPAAQNPIAKANIIFTGTPIFYNDSIGVIHHGDTISEMFGVFSMTIDSFTLDSLDKAESWAETSSLSANFIKLKNYSRDSISLDFDIQFRMTNGDLIEVSDISLNLFPDQF